MSDKVKNVETIKCKPGQIQEDVTVIIHIVDIQKAFPKSFINFVPDGKMPRVSDGRLCIPGIRISEVNHE